MKEIITSADVEVFKSLASTDASYTVRYTLPRSAATHLKGGGQRVLKSSTAHQDEVSVLLPADRYYSAIGRFMVEFSYLETVLKTWIAETANIGDAYQVPLITHDFAMICSIGQQIFPHHRDPACVNDLKPIISRFRALNDVRVKIAHGWWILEGPKPMMQHVSRSSLKRSEHFENPIDVARQADEAVSALLALWSWNSRYYRNLSI